MRAPIEILGVTGTEAIDLGGLDLGRTAGSSPPSSAEPAPTAKRKAKGMSPTARTLAECRKRGWIAGVVEQFVRFPSPGHKVDLFGVIDIVVIVTEMGEAYQFGDEPPRRGAGLLAIQATAGAGGDHARRRTKILAEPRARSWVEAGGRLELWSWALQGARGKAKRWTLRVETYAEMVAASGAAT